MTGRTRRRTAGSGMPRLLEDCEALGRVISLGDATPRTRLETAIGTDLATRLVGALADRRPAVPTFF
jgi:hypothetical protein